MNDIFSLFIVFLGLIIFYNNLITLNVKIEDKSLHQHRQPQPQSLDYLFYQNPNCKNCKKRSINEPIKLPPKWPEDFPFLGDRSNILYSNMYNIANKLKLWDNFYDADNFLFDLNLDSQVSEALKKIQDDPSMKNLPFYITEENLIFGAYILHYISNCGWNAFYQTFNQKIFMDKYNFPCELPITCFAKERFYGNEVDDRIQANLKLPIFSHLIPPIGKFYRYLLTDFYNFTRKFNQTKIYFDDKIFSEKMDRIMDKYSFPLNLVKFYFENMMLRDGLKDDLSRLNHMISGDLLEFKCGMNYLLNSEFGKDCPHIFSLVNLNHLNNNVMPILIGATEISQVSAEQGQMKSEDLQFLKEMHSFIKNRGEIIFSILNHPLMDHDTVAKYRYKPDLAIEVYGMINYIDRNGCEKFIEKYC